MIVVVSVTTVEVTVFVVPVVVTVMGVRPNLEVQHACAAGSGDTSDATAPIAPVHVVAETRVEAMCMKLPRRNSFVGAIFAVWVRNGCLGWSRCCPVTKDCSLELDRLISYPSLVELA